MTEDDFRALCLALPGTTEASHFERAAFRTARRIYATLAADGCSANIGLGPEQLLGDLHDVVLAVGRHGLDAELAPDQIALDDG